MHVAIVILLVHCAWLKLSLFWELLGNSLSFELLILF